MTTVRSSNKPKKPGIYWFAPDSDSKAYKVRVFEKDGSLWHKPMDGPGIEGRVQDMEETSCWSDPQDDNPTG